MSPSIVVHDFEFTLI